MADARNNAARPLRIAFSNIRGERWTAGVYYLKNLFAAVRTQPIGKQPSIILVVSSTTKSESYSELSDLVDEVIVWFPESENRNFKRFADIIQKITGNRIFTERLSGFLKENNIDLFFTRGAPPLHFDLPVLSWIPDFQHLHYPELFSKQEIINREISCKNTADRATKVVLSSKSAFADFTRAIPEHTNNGRVLSFVSQIPKTVYQSDCETLCKKYYLPKKFFHLPNQFWKHKNHSTVIDALKIALRNKPDITVVCTGNTNEYRDDLYFSKLICRISELGLRERMILLGLVPRKDLLLLMRQSVAVIQPSLFEGWNTAIEEAKSLGKRLIVSDISVHREQGNETVQYFPATDPDGLARLLLDVFNTCDAGPDEILENAARNLIRKRTEVYGETFMSIVKEGLSK